MSNHGARQLDTTPATIEVLTEIVKAVGNQAEVYLDGGVMRGTDVLKVGCTVIVVSVHVVNCEVFGSQICVLLEC